jgi:hypothetical protein
MIIWAAVGIWERLCRNQLLISRLFVWNIFSRYSLDLTTLMLEELPEIVNISTKKTNGITYNISSVLAVSEGMSTPLGCVGSHLKVCVGSPCLCFQRSNAAP